MELPNKDCGQVLSVLLPRGLNTTQIVASIAAYDWLAVDVPRRLSVTELWGDDDKPLHWHLFKRFFDKHACAAYYSGIDSNTLFFH